jgi:YD repeat-containing protein
VATATAAAEAEKASAEPGAQPDPTAPPENGLRFQPGRWGSGEVVVEDVTFEDGAGREALSLTTGRPATVAIHYHARQRVEDPVFGVAFFRNDGLHMSGANTQLAEMALGAIEGRGVVRYRMAALPFLAGGYLLTVAIHDRAETHTYDYHSLGYPVRVRLGDVRERYGTLYVPATWSHTAGQDDASREGEAPREGEA